MTFQNAYAGRRVLVTGHTGFKGSWLTLWLREMGASVAGVALAPPTTPSHWDLLRLEIPETRADLLDAQSLEATVGAFRPEIVFHLAAQPLVRESYKQPAYTFATTPLAVSYPTVRIVSPGHTGFLNCAVNDASREASPPAACFTMARATKP